MAIHQLLSIFNRPAWSLLLAVSLTSGCASAISGGGSMSGLSGDQAKSEKEIREAVHDKRSVTSLPKAGPDGL